MPSFPFLLPLAAAAITGLAMPSLGAPVKGTPFPPAQGHFLDKPDGKPSEDISGIACAPPAADGQQRCLVVDDQKTFVQEALLSPRGITPGSFIRVLPKTLPEKGTVVGREPTATCPDPKARWDDLDGEALAYDGSWFYVAGSHGCGRHGGKFTTSSFILVRIGANADGTPRRPEAIERTFRLGAVLQRARTVGPFFGTALQGSPTDNGLNVEGLAVIGDTLYAGLRAPVVDGAAYLVKTAVAPLFAKDGPDPESETIPLFLGGRGVRDLAALPDGRLLVLAGPAREGTESYAVYVANLENTDADRARLVAELETPGKGAKAEALLPLGPSPTQRVLVLFDGVPEGMPTLYPVTLPSGQ